MTACLYYKRLKTGEQQRAELAGLMESFVGTRNYDPFTEEEAAAGGFDTEEEEYPFPSFQFDR